MRIKGIPLSFSRPKPVSHSLASSFARRPFVQVRSRLECIGDKKKYRRLCQVQQR